MEQQAPNQMMEVLHRLFCKDLLSTSVKDTTAFMYVTFWMNDTTTYDYKGQNKK